ncbi:hypothetical protein V6N13_017690 [Hibiscus sabdariffa]|uniref:Uncharacterized protein n=1 Tax=Hibiscus sabdariffa TaxID=183260 RepID=A0ABR2CHN7_9ROSI
MHLQNPYSTVNAAADADWLSIWTETSRSSSSFHRRSVLHVRRYNSFLSRFSWPPDCLFSRLIPERGRFEELEKRERSFVKYEHR